MWGETPPREPWSSAGRHRGVGRLAEGRSSSWDLVTRIEGGIIRRATAPEPGIIGEAAVSRAYNPGMRNHARPRIGRA